MKQEKILLLVFFILCALNINAAGKRGDVTGDGTVNGTDIQAVINLIVAGEYDEKADVNKDGTVNGTDIQAIINIIVGGEAPEPTDEEFKIKDKFNGERQQL